MNLQTQKLKPMKERPITQQQIKALHAQFRQMGFSDEDRHGFISNFTSGRTREYRRTYQRRSRTAAHPVQP